MLKLATFLTISFLAGCSTVPMRPTMESDPAETGIEGLVFINELGKAYEKSSVSLNAMCGQAKPSYQESGKDSYKRYDIEGKKTEDRFGCLTFKPVSDGPPGLQDVMNYTRAGFALSDLYCKNFFRRVATNSQKRGFARNNFNDVGAAISAILGLSKASSALTGGVGAGFGVVDGVFRTYDQQFLISPDLASVQKRVFTAQGALVADVYKKSPSNYFDATMRIADHANLCSYVGMKALINESLNDKSREESPVEETVARFIVAKETMEKAVAAEEARRQAAEEAKAAAAAKAKEEADAAAKVEAEKTKVDQN
jgi:hypothetical protein